MHQNCDECTRLWAEYALATRHYLKMDSRLQAAATSHDRNTVQELSPAVQRAAEERAHITRLIELHEQQAVRPRTNAACA